MLLKGYNGIHFTYTSNGKAYYASTTLRCLIILALSVGMGSNLRMLLRGYSLGDNPGLVLQTLLEICAYTVPAVFFLLFTLSHRVSNPDRSKNCLYPKHPDRLWYSSSLLQNWHRESFPRR